MTYIRSLNKWDGTPRRSDEQFLALDAEPVLVVYFNLAVIRLIIWGPMPYVSFEIGWFLSSPKCAGLQIAVGFKCDPAATKDWQGELKSLAGSDDYVYALTPKELISCRIKHDLDRHPVWDNQGGG